MRQYAALDWMIEVAAALKPTLFFEPGKALSGIAGELHHLPATMEKHYWLHRVLPAIKSLPDDQTGAAMHSLCGALCAEFAERQPEVAAALREQANTEAFRNCSERRFASIDEAFAQRRSTDSSTCLPRHEPISEAEAELTTSPMPIAALAYRQDSPKWAEQALVRMRNDRSSWDPRLWLELIELAFAKPHLWDPERLNMDELSADGSEEGVGRMHAWRTGVASPNWRASGLADFKRLRFLDDIVAEHANGNLFRKHGGHDAQALALASHLGDRLLSCIILTTDSWLRRRELRAAGDLSIEELDLAAEFEFIYTTTAVHFAGYSPEQARHMMNALFNFKARAFEVEYIAEKQYLREANQPGGITAERWRQLYGPSTEVIWGTSEEHSRGYTDAAGWRSDGENDDWGPVNGPFACQGVIGDLAKLTHMLVAALG